MFKGMDFFRAAVTVFSVGCLSLYSSRETFVFGVVVLPIVGSVCCEF